MGGWDLPFADRAGFFMVAHLIEWNPHHDTPAA